MTNPPQSQTRAALALVTLLCGSCAPAGAPQDSPEFVRAMNRGRAHLENRAAADSVAAFQQAVELAPRSAPALRNLARAQLLARDATAALAVLERARGLERDAASTSYLTGLAYARESSFAEALPHLEEAVRLDPHTAALRLQLAHAYQAEGRHPEAIEQLRETVRLDPFHTTAHYRLARYARQNRDMREYERRQRELTRLRELFGDENRTPEILERCVHTRAEPAVAPEGRGAGVAIAVRFSDATGELLLAPGGVLAAITAAAVIETDDDGRPVLFVAGAGGAGLLVPRQGGALEYRSLELAPLAPGDGAAALAGNFHDPVPEGERYDPARHARSDVLLLGAGGVRLLERGVDGGFADVTERAGLAGVEARGGAWVDYDHDGDLDLALARSAGLELWQNGGDGRFEEVAAAVGLGEAGAAAAVAAADLDADVALDLVVARGAEPTKVFENQRAGRYAPRPAPPGPWPAAHRVLLDDLDNDGLPDAVLVAAGEVVIVAANGGRTRLDLAGLAPTAALLIDYDNDGWLDLAVAGEAAGAGALRLWRNTGAAGWQGAEAAAGLAELRLAVPRELLAADLDGDGDSDLLVLTAEGPRVLRNDGGNVHRQLKIRLVGTKTNPAGLGTQVEVRAGGLSLARAVGRLPIEIGLGPHETLDAVRTVWTNGVMDNQIALAVPEQPLTIVEKNVAAGSCPYLYAWDGERFRFVTDLLGNSPLGLSLARDRLMPADPEELVAIGELAARGGDYVLQVTEELREVLYLDEARLVAVDHDPGVEVHATDRLMPPPFPPSQLWALTGLEVPARATGDDGVERTAALAAVDGVFAAPGEPLPPPLRGVTRPLALTLSFDRLGERRRPVLAATGWLQYGDASTNIALSQNPSVAVVPPTLEVETAGGAWRRLDVTVGMPAGKTKTIVVDLAGHLPPGARRLRLVTSFEIRWDRIALGERLPASAVTRHDVAPDAAELAWHGFGEILSRAPGHPTTPAWEAVAARPPWRTSPEGWVTRYGDARQLVAARDGRLALASGGDALELRFAAAGFPALPPGKVRTFFFYSVGWDKDADPNVVGGESVEPLPVAAAAGEGWRLTYNTRWIPRDRFAPEAAPH